MYIEVKILKLCLNHSYIHSSTLAIELYKSRNSYRNTIGHSSVIIHKVCLLLNLPCY